MSHPPFVAHDPKHVNLEAEKPRRAMPCTASLTFDSNTAFCEAGRRKRRGRTDLDAGNSALAVSGPADTLEIQWLDVAWVTTRDQVLSPLAHWGALWAIAGHFLTPFLGQARSFIPTPPEGGIAKWLHTNVHPAINYYT
ncbi:hypothetical protein K438DRAFT_1859375, partial [Mycena galopus ATCC 62051]